MAEIYPWLQPLWQQWQALSVSGRVPAALLCAAQEGVGVSELIEKLCRTLVCSNSDSEPCGMCHSCSLSLSGSHPDIHWVAPESKGKSVTVEQIRNCNRWALESSALGGKRIIVITPAEAMNESASNALLKTLESPPENCIFILRTHNRTRLLATILSRCQLWELAEPDPQLTLQWLEKNCSSAVCLTGLRLSQGSPLKAQAFFEQGGYEAFIELENRFTEVMAQPFPDAGALVKLIAPEPQTRLMWLALLLADVQKVHFLLNEPGMCTRSAELAKLIAYQPAWLATEKLNRIREQLLTHTGLNAELLITNWLLELHEDICS